MHADKDVKPHCWLRNRGNTNSNITAYPVLSVRLGSERKLNRAGRDREERWEKSDRLGPDRIQVPSEGATERTNKIKPTSKQHQRWHGYPKPEKKKNPNNRCVRKWAKSVLVRQRTARQCDGDCPGKKEKSCGTFVLLTGLGLDDVTQFGSFLGLSGCSDCVWFHGAAVFMLRFMEHSVLCEVLRNGLMGFKYPAFILKLFFVLDFVENSSRIIYLIRYF